MINRIKYTAKTNIAYDNGCSALKEISKIFAIKYTLS